VSKGNSCLATFGVVAVLGMLVVAGVMLLTGGSQQSSASARQAATMVELVCDDCFEEGIPAFVYATSNLDGGSCIAQWGDDATILGRATYSGGRVVKVKTDHCTGWMMDTLVRRSK
jgi:hypothetical protein